MKNKPYPPLLGGLHLFNEIKKRTPKYRETIPLRCIIKFIPVACLQWNIPVANWFTFCREETKNWGTMGPALEPQRAASFQW
jgi:hypothetical protein